MSDAKKPKPRKKSTRERAGIPDSRFVAASESNTCEESPPQSADPPTEEEETSRTPPQEASKEVESIALTPYRLKVVELATQMATSQIAASINLTASHTLAMSIRRIAAEYIRASGRLKTDLETLALKPELMDHAFVDRAYASLLESSTRSAKSAELLPLDHAKYNELFAGAMARAQMLLRSSLTQAPIVHAEQMFRPDQVLSENKIGEAFETWEWPILEKRSTFHGFMVRIEEWFVRHLSRENGPEEDDRYNHDAELLAEVLAVGRRRSKEDCFRQILDLVENHKPTLAQSISYQQSMESVMDLAWRTDLIMRIFCDRRPSPRPRGNRRIFRKFRPWALFRYLRHWTKDDVEGLEIYELLNVPRHRLPASLEPDPPDSKFQFRYEFGDIGKLLDD